MDLINIKFDEQKNVFEKIKPITENYKFSCSTGKSAYSSNDFELKMPYQLGNALLEIGDLVMYGNTEFGGIISHRTIDTRSNEVTYSGHSLRGYVSHQTVRNDDSETRNVVSHIGRIMGLVQLGITSIINNSSYEAFAFTNVPFAKQTDTLDSLVNCIDSVYTFYIENGKFNILINPKTTHKFDASQVDMVFDENHSRAYVVFAYNPKTFEYSGEKLPSAPPLFLKLEKAVESDKETAAELYEVAKKEFSKERTTISSDIFSNLKKAEVGDNVIASILEIGLKITKTVVEKSIKIVNGNAEITYTLEG